MYDRLYRLPPDLDELYKRLVERLDPTYSDEANLYFDLAQMRFQYGDDVSILDLVFATVDAYADPTSRSWTAEDIKELKSYCEKVKHWVNVRTMRLLEVHDHSEYKYYEHPPRKLSCQALLDDVKAIRYFHSCQTVRYVHLSFLQF